MDGDGPEVEWVAECARLIEGAEISVSTITFEATGVNKPALLSRWVDALLQFQRLGYAVLRLDFADERRFLNSRGWDVYSPNGTYARLDRFGALERDALEEELLSIRAMRHVWRVRANLNHSEWRTVLSLDVRHLRPRSVAQFVLTREPLLYPAFGSKRGRSRHWQATHREPRGDGWDR